MFKILSSCGSGKDGDGSRNSGVVTAIVQMVGHWRNIVMVVTLEAIINRDSGHDYKEPI